MTTILVLNGPNLNLLGEREPHLYGHTTLAQVEERCKDVGRRLHLDVQCMQSNHEGQLVDWIQDARKTVAGIVFNPAAYSFTSMAILDAIKASQLPLVEVHVTNIHRREAIYHKSYVSLAAIGVICGLGPFGYEAALTFLSEHLKAQADKPSIHTDSVAH